MSIIEKRYFISLGRQVAAWRGFRIGVARTGQRQPVQAIYLGAEILTGAKK